MRLYESVFIARQDISAVQVETLTSELTGIITGAGGKIHKHEYWGLKTLAYRINKNRKGHYVLLNVEADPGTMDEYGRPGLTMSAWISSTDCLAKVRSVSNAPWRARWNCGRTIFPCMP